MKVLSILAESNESAKNAADIYSYSGCDCDHDNCDSACDYDNDSN